MEDNTLTLLAGLPVEYYQMLESYIDGRTVEEFAEFEGKDEKPAYVEKPTDKGFVELVAACSAGVWRVKEPEKAEAYYNKNFPLKKSEPPKLTREEAVFKAQAMRNAEKAKEKRSAKDSKAIQKANEKSYKAYMKGLKKRDRVAYDRLSALHKIEKAEQKKLMSLNAKLVKHNEKYGYLNELELLNPDRSLFTPKELEKLTNLRREERELLRAKNSYAEALEKENLRRLEAREISREHYNIRQSQLINTDFTYTVMTNEEEMRSAGQAGFGNETRRDEKEMLRREHEKEGRQAVRAQVNLEAEVEQAETAERDEEIVDAEELLKQMEREENWDSKKPIEQMYDKFESSEEIVDADDPEL